MLTPRTIIIVGLALNGREDAPRSFIASNKTGLGKVDREMNANRIAFAFSRDEFSIVVPLSTKIRVKRQRQISKTPLLLLFCYKIVFFFFMNNRHFQSNPVCDVLYELTLLQIEK